MHDHGITVVVKIAYPLCHTQRDLVPRQPIGHQIVPLIFPVQQIV
uniref:Uncharacterized protein n=1 Tax=Rhizophora mucronata TaxID=61149 RepID=A0A2P2P6N2_RHIMU